MSSPGTITDALAAAAAATSSQTAAAELVRNAASIAALSTTPRPQEPATAAEPAVAR